MKVKKNKNFITFFHKKRKFFECKDYTHEIYPLKLEKNNWWSCKFNYIINQYLFKEKSFMYG